MTTTELIDGIAERIVVRLGFYRHIQLTDTWAFEGIVAELEPLKAMIENALAITSPDAFHTHGDFATEDAMRGCPRCRAETALRTALNELMKESR